MGELLTVVLAHSLGPAGGTGLDLTGPQGDGQVGNVLGLGLTGSLLSQDFASAPRSFVSIKWKVSDMARHDRPSSALR